MTSLIDQFLSQYRKEFDYYEMAGRVAHNLLQSRLDASGIRAIVSSRAKNLTRLEEKVKNRSATKNYSSVESIYDDIVDLAGVRIALYFPGQMSEVEKIVRDLFTLLEEPKKFPDASTPSSTHYKKRFSGYAAIHYRVNLKPPQQDNRYCDAKIEIQVASVLMHAWSEVDHDLDYKPMQGTLSDGEYAILDELNGLVIAGEIALERLQVAIEERIAKSQQTFNNQYELCTFIENTSQEEKRVNGQQMMGNISRLLAFATILEINTPKGIKPYIELPKFSFDEKTVAEIAIDQILFEKPERYKQYLESVSSSFERKFAWEGYADSAVQFLTKWNKLQKEILNYVQKKNPSESTYQFNPILLLELQVLTIDQFNRYEFLRTKKDSLVHGVEIVDSKDMLSYIEAVDKLYSEVSKTIGL